MIKKRIFPCVKSERFKKPRISAIRWWFDHENRIIVQGLKMPKDPEAKHESIYWVKDQRFCGFDIKPSNKCGPLA